MLSASQARSTFPADPSRRRPLDSPFDFSGLIDEYRDEARQQLDVLDAALLTLEREGILGEEQRAELLRALHTLKGNSGMLGLKAVRDYVHAIEETLKAPPARWSQAALDRLFEGAAALRRAIEQAGRGGEEEALARLEALRRAATETAEAADAEAAGREEGAELEQEEEANAAEAQRDRSMVPEAPAPAEISPPPPEPGAELLRIPFAKLDVLMAQITELIEAQSGLEQLVRTHRAPLEAAGLRRAFAERSERLDRAAERVSAAAMELRLVPVARVFGRFPSLVRDLAREQGKRVRVVLEGESTEMDKSTIDVLAEPILHLVRNAVDHGIDTPEQREAQGKPPEGTIVLRAQQVGDRVRIEVEDDGTGLDHPMILARAREAGIVGEREQLAPEEIDALIFHPGFSTRRQASTLSGRGIGLDVVLRSAMRLRGSLAVEPGPAGGTRFVLYLPLTLAMVPALLFESDGETLALPAAEIEETLRSAAPEYVGGAEVVRHRDELVPLAHPARIFGWDGRPAVGGGEDTEEAERTERFAILVRRGGRAAAVAADRLLEQRDVVVRALPAYLGQPRGVSGATVAPGGRVILLLDAGAIIDLNLDAYRRERRAR